MDMLTNAPIATKKTAKRGLLVFEITLLRRRNH